MDILDCYLQRNLARNGGYLDEVQFAVHTDVAEDLHWLSELVSRTPGYRILEVQQETFVEIWKQHMSEPGTLYIKLDDDVVSTKHKSSFPLLILERLIYMTMPFRDLSELS